MSTQNKSFSYKLSGEQQDALEALLSSGNFKPTVVPHTRIAVEGEQCRINLYTSGKLLVQGKGAAEFVQFYLEPNVLMEARLGYENILNPERLQPHIGIDESGKGDFFGPMVIAGAYVDETLFGQLEKLGVKDSKSITSDKKALNMGRDIIKLLGKRYSLVRIGPGSYNRMYAKMKNVNQMLAWGHAQAIENLLEIVPDCPRAISDKFGREDQIIRKLKERGRKIKLEQYHKAESDMAVAAASIIARAAFLDALQKLEAKYGVAMLKGASARVRESAEELVQKHGPKVLLETSKCHFRTTDQVLEAVGHSREDLGPDGQHVSKSARPS
jgi:ribonuclease HIII